MIRKEEVLEFVANQNRHGLPVCYEDVMAGFGLSLQAAENHLKRLWRDRLIETISWRPDGFKYRLQPYELFISLRFRLTHRGVERLRWYRRGGW